MPRQSVAKHMIILKTERDLEAMRPACAVAATVLAEVAAFIRPGVSPRQVDEFAADQIRKLAAKRGTPAAALRVGLRGGGCRIARCHAIEFGKIASGTHRMHQPVDDVETDEGTIERFAIEGIPVRHLDVGDLFKIRIGATNDGADVCPLVAQLRHEATSNVA